MRELDIIRIIENSLSKNSHIGDDCAYLKDLGIVVSQDSLVEDVHFMQKISSPEDIAYKSVMANLSDIYASGAIPKYLTIALSIPPTINDDFIVRFYKIINELSNEYDFEIVGGDITGSEKIMISICAIGKTKGQNISSRSYAKAGDVVVTTGVHGSSAAGLWVLQNSINSFDLIAQKHLRPIAQREFSFDIASKVKRYAMMDSSDGLVDSVFKISEASGVSISLDLSKIPYDKEIKEIANLAKVDFNKWIFYGGEDFQLVACLSRVDLDKLSADYTVIGNVEELIEGGLIKIIDNDNVYKIENLEQSFNHFKE